MKGLLKYLSPFAPDQSGAASVLYGLGGITVICDAGGCTGNICGFDEPRWFMEKSAIFSAGLRDMDAILGRDDRLIAKLKDTAEKVDAKFAAIIGTPVPAVIATDYKALRRMAEKRCGFPVLTIACTGTRLYDEGEEEAYLQLFQRFTGEPAGSAGTTEASGAAGSAGATETSEPAGSAGTTEALGLAGFAGTTEALGLAENTGATEAVGLKGAARTTKVTGAAGMPGTAEAAGGSRGKIGVIGATPLDLGGAHADRAIRESLRQEGYREVCCYGMGDGLEAIREAGTVEKNLVVSPAGLKAARYLEGRFGTPYQMGYPLLGEAFKEQLHSLRGKRVLVIHQQAAANEIRREIRLPGEVDVTAATWFMQDGSLKEPQDFRLETEGQFIRQVSQGGYDVVIGDTLFKRALKEFRGMYIPVPHFAVSGVCTDG